MILLSPAKSLRSDFIKPHKHSDIRFPSESQELIDLLKDFTNEEIARLMKVSEAISTENTARYASYSYPFDEASTPVAIHSFLGDVYKEMKTEYWSVKDLNFAQKNIRILSGLYGMLRPLDLMHPYRLEMGTRLANNKGPNLYAFWYGKVTAALNEDIYKGEHTFIVNLASNEYWTVLQVSELDVPVYTIHFREMRDEKLKFISFNAKKARGMMASYIIAERVKSVDALKAFDMDGYAFEEEMSSETDLYFVR